jgi:hypothetical protein
MVILHKQHTNTYYLLIRNGCETIAYYSNDTEFLNDHMLKINNKQFDISKKITWINNEESCH